MRRLARAAYLREEEAQSPARRALCPRRFLPGHLSLWRAHNGGRRPMDGYAGLDAARLDFHVEGLLKSRQLSRNWRARLRRSSRLYREGFEAGTKSQGAGWPQAKAGG